MTRDEIVAPAKCAFFLLEGKAFACRAGIHI